jgi:hypothetical protein
MFNDITESSDCSEDVFDATVDEAVVEDDNNACHVIEREHPSSDRDFAVVAVLAALVTEMDATGSELPPLWPRVLHCFPCFDRSSLREIESPHDYTSVSPLMRAMCSPLLRHQQAGARGIQLLLTRRDPPIDRLVAAGAMRPLAAMLEDDSVPLTQMHVIMALEKISHAPKHTAGLMKIPGAVARFVRLLLSANDAICLPAARMLGKCGALLSSTLRNDALSNLMQMLTRSNGGEKLTLRRSITWTISECCRAQPPPPLSLTAAAIPVLVEAIGDPDTEVVINALWALAYISYCSSEYISTMIDNGALRAIMQQLQSPSSNAARPALRCLCNILHSDAHLATMVVEHGAIAALCSLRELLRQEPSWFSERKKGILQALANIAGGSAQHVNALLQAGVFDFIEHDVGNCGADEDVASDAEIIRHESQRIVVNALRNASDEDRIAIIGSASFRALLAAASSQKISFAGLEGIDLALKQAFGKTAESTALLPGARLSLLVEVLARSNGDEKPTLRRCVVWAIKNCCRAQPPPPLSLIAAAIPVLVAVTQDPDTEMVADALWALAYVSDHGGEYISAVIDNGALPAIMQQLQNRSNCAPNPALCCLCKILRGDSRQAALAIEHGAVTTLCTVVQQAWFRSEWYSEEKHDILQTFGNIAGNGAQHVNALLQAGVFDFITRDVGENYANIVGEYDGKIAAEAQDTRGEGQRIVANGLRNASDADRTAIIRSASFRALLTAASMQRVSFAGMEGIDFVLNCRANVDADELVAIVDALRDIKWEEAQQHVERINGWLRRFKAEPLQAVTAIQQPRRKQPPPARR